MRISESHLKQLVDRLNEETENSIEAYKVKIDKKGAREHSRFQVGSYYLEYGLNGVLLVQVSNKNGGVSCPFGYRRGTKAELFDKIHCYLKGLEDGRKAA